MDTVFISILILCSLKILVSVRVVLTIIRLLATRKKKVCGHVTWTRQQQQQQLDWLLLPSDTQQPKQLDGSSGKRVIGRLSDE